MGLQLCDTYNAMTPVRLEHATPRSRVKHSTTEPLHSHLLFDAHKISTNVTNFLVETKSCQQTYEPWHGVSNNVVCATSKVSDQPAHTRSLIRAFAIRLKIL